MPRNGRPSIRFGRRHHFRFTLGGVVLFANSLMRCTSASVNRRQLFLSRATSSTLEARSQRFNVIGAIPIMPAASVRV